MILVIISIFFEDDIFSMTANLPYRPPMNTYNDYYQTYFSDFFIVSDVIFVV